MLRPGCVPLFCDVPRPWVLQPRLCGLGCHGGVSGGSGRVLGVCAVDAHIEDAFWVVFFLWCSVFLRLAAGFWVFVGCGLWPYLLGGVRGLLVSHTVFLFISLLCSIAQ